MPRGAAPCQSRNCLVVRDVRFEKPARPGSPRRVLSWILGFLLAAQVIDPLANGVDDWSDVEGGSARSQRCSGSSSAWQSLDFGGSRCVGEPKSH